MNLGTNPLRLSFNGKEIVISRYNLFQKLKQNHHPRINFAQEKARVQEARNQQQSNESKVVTDSYRIAKTIMHQGFLIPLPQIVQPVMWAYAMDTLSILPQPDFLILADECADYHHSFDLSDEFSNLGAEARNDVEMAGDGRTKKTCEVVNPGNFSHDLSFLALYPNNKEEPV